MATCAIVGAGPSLGSSLAREFSRIADIVLISRDSNHTDDLAKEVREAGRNVLQVSVDATDRNALQNAFGEVKTKGGVPDIVIYNPANMVMAPYSTVSAAELEETWPVMLYAPMNVTAAVLPDMISRGRGTLLFTGGGFGIDPSVSRAPHSIAKAALRNYARGLFLELQEKGIHAGTVTVHRPLEAGEDIARCAATFVAMHEEPAGSWTWEQHYGRSPGDAIASTMG